MELNINLNGKTVRDRIEPDLLLIDFLRAHGCFSVKRGCETSNCGLCTVLMDGVPILPCSMLAARADGRRIQTLEGLQEEASDFIGFIADQGADQCGFCNPGFVMNTIALLREIPAPTDDQIRSGTCAAAPAMSGSSGASAPTWTAGKEIAMEHKEYKYIGKSFRKKDAAQLLLGKPVYVDDVTPQGRAGGQAAAQLPCQRPGGGNRHLCREKSYEAH